MTHRRFFSWLIALAAPAVFAQAPVVVREAVHGAIGGSGGAAVGTSFFYATGGEFSFDAQVVKGNPYTAEAVTERVQTLADGNRITNSQTASVARDSEGRTRREEVMGALGPLASGSAPAHIVFINDPVEQVNYILEPDHTARKLPAPGRMSVAIPDGGAPGPVTIAAPPPPPPVPGAANTLYIAKSARIGEPGKTESLGTQIVEGVQAEGKRTTTVIPAGQIGNEQPIEITYERWYSPELQAVVMTRRSDPRMGETTYRLTNIQRNEPAASLFQVPSDYKLVDSGDTVRAVTFKKDTKQ